MKIFMSAMCFDNGKSGIAEYTRALVENLSEDHEVVVAILRKDITSFGITSKNVRFVVVPSIFSFVLLNLIWHLLLFPIYCVFYKCDNAILPAANRRLSLWRTVPVVGIIHDLSQYHVSGKYDLLRMTYVKGLLPCLLGALTHKVCISETTKSDVVKYWGVRPEELNVLYNGYDKDQFNLSEVDPDDFFLRKYELKSPYLIYVSRIEAPGKNHVNLISAFEKIVSDFGAGLDLVLVASDWLGADCVKKRIESSPFKSRIKMLGFVPSEALPSLYKGAELMVFPSYYEGFGMPLIEAMGCGVATCCSSAAALVETAGGATLHFDPDDVNDMAVQIMCLLSSERLRSVIIRAGLTRTDAFDWKQLSRGIENLLNSQKMPSVSNVV